MQQSEEASAGSTEQKYKTLLVTVEDGLRTITLNRPKKFNAITTEVRPNDIPIISGYIAYRKPQCIQFQRKRV